MSQDLIPADLFNGLPSTNLANESFEEVATATDFLQRLQLISKGKYVDSKQAHGGDYAIILDSETCKSLGGHNRCPRVRSPSQGNRHVRH